MSPHLLRLIPYLYRCSPSEKAVCIRKPWIRPALLPDGKRGFHLRLALRAALAGSASLRSALITSALHASCAKAKFPGSSSRACNALQARPARADSSNLSAALPAARWRGRRCVLRADRQKIAFLGALEITTTSSVRPAASHLPQRGRQGPAPQTGITRAPLPAPRTGWHPYYRVTVHSRWENDLICLLRRHPPFTLARLLGERMLDLINTGGGRIMRVIRIVMMRRRYPEKRGRRRNVKANTFIYHRKTKQKRQSFAEWRLI